MEGCSGGRPAGLACQPDLELTLDHVDHLILVLMHVRRDAQAGWWEQLEGVVVAVGLVAAQLQCDGVAQDMHGAAFRRCDHSCWLVHDMVSYES